MHFLIVDKGGFSVEKESTCQTSANGYKPKDAHQLRPLDPQTEEERMLRLWS